MHSFSITTLLFTIFALAPAMPLVARNTTLPACTDAELALAAGIAANIADQQNEVLAVTALGNVLLENPVSPALFNIMQSSLLNFVTTGIAIRQNNQAIAPPGNSAIPGLAIVANAQVAELNLTMSLGSGGVVVARDNATVATLKMDFAGGIVQNMKNLAAVSPLTCP